MGPWRNPLSPAVVGVRAAIEDRIPADAYVRLSRWRQERYAHRAEAQLAADPQHLQHFERSTFSQNGEDGIVAEIFRRIGVTSRTFVEIGAADGRENCTRALLEEGWSGVWVEGDDERAATARAVIGGRSVEVVAALLEPAAATAALDAAGAPVEPDLLVIDIDGNDAWMWRAVALARRPRVVVIEVNAKIGPWLRWSVPYRAGRAWDDTAWHGASLAALAALGRAIGYTLVACDSRGVNAFFVRTDQAGPFSRRSVRAHWVPPRYLAPFGHPWTPPAPIDAAPLDDAGADALSVRFVRADPGPRSAGRPVIFEVEVTNRGVTTVGESRTCPVRLAAWWEDEAGGRLSADEPTRSVQRWRAAPKSSRHLLGLVPAPATPGRAVLVATLVQEDVRWLDDRPECAARSTGWTILASSGPATALSEPVKESRVR